MVRGIVFDFSYSYKDQNTRIHHVPNAPKKKKNVKSRYRVNRKLFD